MRTRLRQLLELAGRAPGVATAPIKIRRLTDQSEPERSDAEELKRRLDATRERLKQQIPPPRD